MNMNKYLVRDENGSVDSDATIAKFRTDLSGWLAARQDQEGKVAAAVHSIFDQYKSERINMPALTNLALSNLGATPSNYVELAETLQTYVRNNAGENGIFTIGKGKGGGVARVADLKSAK